MRSGIVSAIAGLAMLAGVGTAEASAVQFDISFTATNFTTEAGQASNNTPPFDEISGSFSFSFDPNDFSRPSSSCCTSIFGIGIDSGAMEIGTTSWDADNTTTTMLLPGSNDNYAFVWAANTQNNSGSTAFNNTVVGTEDFFFSIFSDSSFSNFILGKFQYTTSNTFDKFEANNQQDGPRNDIFATIAVNQEVVFDNIVAPIPIPAALPLLLTAFGMLSVLGWRRHKHP